eukprot:ctg_1732.g476
MPVTNGEDSDACPDPRSQPLDVLARWRAAHAPNRSAARRRVLVTGDRGGLALHRPQGVLGAVARQPALRVYPTRRHRTDRVGSGPDIPLGVPGVAGALQVQRHQDHQDQCHRHAEHARAGQAHRRAAAAGQHQRGVRRPAAAPADGRLLGQREPDRPRGHPHCTHLQHVRTAHDRERRPRGEQLCSASTARRTPDGVRRRTADALLLLRERSGGRAGAPDEHRGYHRPDQSGQPHRILHAAAGPLCAREDSAMRGHPLPAAHPGRPVQAPTGHCLRAPTARLGAAGAAVARTRLDGGGVSSATVQVLYVRISVMRAAAGTRSPPACRDESSRCACGSGCMRAARQGCGEAMATPSRRG